MSPAGDGAGAAPGLLAAEAVAVHAVVVVVAACCWAAVIVGGEGAGAGTTPVCIELSAEAEGIGAGAISAPAIEGLAAPLGVPAGTCARIGPAPAQAAAVSKT